jgi:hypothetical protein
LSHEGEGLARAIGAATRMEAGDLGDLLEDIKTASARAEPYTPEQCRVRLGRNADAIITHANQVVDAVAARLTASGRAELYRVLDDPKVRRNPQVISTISQLGHAYGLTRRS